MAYSFAEHLRQFWYGSLSGLVTGMVFSLYDDLKFQFDSTFALAGAIALTTCVIAGLLFIMSFFIGKLIFKNLP